MKKIFSCFLLYFFCINAHAEWTKYDDFNGRTLYFDAPSMKRDGDILKVWLLHDFKSPQELSPGSGKYLSSRIQVHFNCRDMTSSLAHASTHTERQAKGKVIASKTFATTDWTPIAPATAYYDFAEIGCAKVH